MAVMKAPMKASGQELPLSLPQFMGHTILDAPKCMENRAPPVINRATGFRSPCLFRLLK